MAKKTSGGFVKKSNISIVIDTSKLVKSMSELTRGAFAADSEALRYSYEEMRRIRNNLRMNAPMSSGRYLSGWDLITKEKDGFGCRVSMVNNTPYGPILEAGVPKGEPPWGLNVGTLKPSAKVVFSKGRVWSKQAVGGTINPYLTHVWESRFCRALGNSMFKVFKAESKGV